jgi:polyisoprenoid-binding protein YceI
MTTVATLFSSPQSIGVWKLVPEDSTISFKARTMWGIAPVNGGFTEFCGDGQIGESQAVLGRVVVKAASVDTKIGARDKHLRSADFFETKKYPYISVVVDGIEGISGDTVDLRGDLTVRTKTAPLPLQAKVTLLDDGAVRVSAQTQLDRRDFRIDSNMIGMFGNKVTVSADLIFRRTVD